MTGTEVIETTEKAEETADLGDGSEVKSETPDPSLNGQVAPENPPTPETEEDEDDAIEWDQQRPAPKKTDAGSPDIKALQQQVSEKDAQIEQLRQENEALKQNPVLMLWDKYSQSQPQEVSVQGFLSQFQSQSSTSSLTDEQIMREHFSALAKENGVPDDEIQDIVDERFEKWNDPDRTDRLDRAAQLKQAKADREGKYKETLTKAEQSWQDQQNKLRDEANKWAQPQFENLKSYINKVVEKGRFKKRNVDKAWGEKVLAKAVTSGILLDPDLIEYDEKGNIYVPDAVDVLDELIYLKEHRQRRKNQSSSLTAAEIEQRAAAAHNKKIESSLNGNLTAEQELAQWNEFIKKQAQPNQTN